jgi:hypothetical protein
MKLHLIDGTFSTEDAKALLNKFIAAKIEFLESKISPSVQEEEIKTLDIDLIVEWEQG